MIQLNLCKQSVASKNELSNRGAPHYNNDDTFCTNTPKEISLRGTNKVSCKYYDTEHSQIMSNVTLK